MIQKKVGANIYGLKSEVWAAIRICDSVMNKYGVDCIITSGTEGKHREGSKHYTFEAVDLRSRDIPPTKRVDVLHDLVLALGAEYDVIFEGDHYHIEYDPKK